MLAIPELWDTCQWELLIGCKNNLREKYVVVSKVVKSWVSEELSDIKHGVGPAGFRFCFGPVFTRYAPFPTFCNENEYPVLVHVGSLWSAF